jgi:hypothetical protein
VPQPINLIWLENLPTQFAVVFIFLSIRWLFESDLQLILRQTKPETVVQPSNIPDMRQLFHLMSCASHRNDLPKKTRFDCNQNEHDLIHQ